VGRALIVIGKAWLYLAAMVILLGYASILYFEGWGQLQQILSPFNLRNWLSVGITLLPGIGLVGLGAKLNKARISSKGALTTREDQAEATARVRNQEAIDKALMDTEARETARGLIEDYLGPDHKVISMQGFSSALTQALKAAREKGRAERSDGKRPPIEGKIPG
jgi:hypothetical protein